MKQTPPIFGDSIVNVEDYALYIKCLYDNARFHTAPHADQTPKVTLYNAIGFNTIHKTPHFPILYHYNTFNGRLAVASKTAHIFPSKLTLIRNFNTNKEWIIGDHKVGIQIWKTRCAKPELHLVTYDLITKQIEKFPRCLKILRNYYCDLNYTMSEDDYKEMINKYIEYIVVNRLYYDPKRGLHQNTRYSNRQNIPTFIENSKVFKEGEHEGFLNADAKDAYYLTREKSKLHKVLHKNQILMKVELKSFSLRN
jgi:hypothetical protein